MKLTMNTAQLQGMLTRVIKGAGFDKNKPETEYVAISLTGGKLVLMTIDELRANYLYMTADNIEGDDMYVAVKVEFLTKLVSKITSEKITLELNKTSLTVKGNGQYQIALEVPDGEPVRLYDPLDCDKGKIDLVGTTDSTTINNILTSIKSALLTKDDYPWYRCYYAGTADVITSDTFTVGCYGKGFMNAPYLIDPRTMDLVGLLTGEIKIYVDNDKMLFKADDGYVYTNIPDGIEMYSIDALRDYVVQNFEYSCKVSKTPIMNLLERIAMFVGVYDNGEIKLSFEEDGLVVSSKDNAEEKIMYTEGTGKAGKFECRTDVNTLMSQIKSQLGGVIEIQYGKDSAIKLIDGDVTSVVALMADD